MKDFPGLNRLESRSGGSVANSHLSNIELVEILGYAKLVFLTMAASSKRLSEIDSFKTVHQTVLVAEKSVYVILRGWADTHLGVGASSGSRAVHMSFLSIVAFGIVEDAQVIRTARLVTGGRGHGG